MINILIADDSETATKLLRHILEQAPDFNIIGHAKNGEQAVQMAQALKPDLITMDLQMPVKSGLEAISEIMEKCPTPIVVISSILNHQTNDMTFAALEAGALSVLEKPTAFAGKKYDLMCKRLIATLRSMSEIKSIRRRRSRERLTVTPNLFNQQKTGSFDIVAIGASVGGPQALRQILANLPKTFPVPIVIVQHMSPGFISNFTNWLGDHIPLTVKTAADQEILKKGLVYFAPDGYHLEVLREEGLLRAKLTEGDPVSGFYPSVTVLLESITKSCGKQAIGVLLTGMGRDGAEGLLHLKQKGGHTIIQDQKSAVVFGMAGVAQSIGAVDRVVEIDQLGDYLIQATKRHAGKDG